MPSCLMMRVRASVIDVYFNPMPSIVLIWNRRRRTSLPAASISNHTLSTFSAASLQGVTKKKEYSQWICACLCHGTRDGTRRQLAHRARVLVAVRGEILAHILVHHEIEADVRRDTGYRGHNTPVQRPQAALGRVHIAHGEPHTR